MPILTAENAPSGGSRCATAAPLVDLRSLSAEDDNDCMSWHAPRGSPVSPVSLVDAAVTLAGTGTTIDALLARDVTSDATRTNPTKQYGANPTPDDVSPMDSYQTQVDLTRKKTSKCKLRCASIDRLCVEVPSICKKRAPSLSNHDSIDPSLETKKVGDTVVCERNRTNCFSFLSREHPVEHVFDQEGNQHSIKLSQALSPMHGREKVKISAENRDTQCLELPAHFCDVFLTTFHSDNDPDYDSLQSISSAQSKLYSLQNGLHAARSFPSPSFYPLGTSNDCDEHEFATEQGLFGIPSLVPDFEEACGKEESMRILVNSLY
jgi:hypothetical protein